MALASWQDFLAQQAGLPYYPALQQRVQAARDAGLAIYPPADQVYRAFDLTPFAAVRVVILGQVPYLGAW